MPARFGGQGYLGLRGVVQASEAHSGQPTIAPLLARGVQVAAVQALVEAADGGEGRFVVSEGGAGIGKTRLVDESRAIGRQAGMRILSARGGVLEGEFA
jgi:hypothetical protein